MFVDANAIFPARAHETEVVIVRAGTSFVNGGIVGSPPALEGRTWLDLSGCLANDVAELFGSGRLATEVVLRERPQVSRDFA